MSKFDLYESYGIVFEDVTSELDKLANGIFDIFKLRGEQK